MMLNEETKQALADENAQATTVYILNKLREFEAAQNITIGQMTTRTSFLEKRIADLEAKHGALVALVYSRGGK